MDIVSMLYPYYSSSEDLLFRETRACVVGRGARLVRAYPILLTDCILACYRYYILQLHVLIKNCLFRGYDANTFEAKANSERHLQSASLQALVIIIIILSLTVVVRL